MNLPYILIAIVALMAIMVVFLFLQKTRRESLIGPRYNRRVHIIVAIGATVLMVALWIFYDLPVALLPVLIVPQWITLFARRGEPTPTKRLILALVVGLTVAVVLATVGLWIWKANTG